MKKLVALMLCLVLVLGMCAMPASAEEEKVYRTLYSSEISSLNYLTTAVTAEFSVAANVIDTLVEYDNYGVMQPSLAESWEYDAENLTYTFHLRQDATWVNAKGEFYANVTAHDFVSAAQYLLNAENASATANIFYSVVAGAEEYYNGTVVSAEGEEAAPAMEWDTVGVKALDDYTLQYTLKEDVPYFLSMLTYVCFMPVNGQFLEEKGADFGVVTSNENILYNGAYILSTLEAQTKRVYSKNESNWDAENVFITRIEETYNKEAGTIGAEMYRNGQIDAAGIDSETAAIWLADETTYELIRPVRNSFYTYFWGFNFNPVLDAEYEPENWLLAANNENFRKSIYHGLDRLNAKAVMDPDNPEALLFNTITPPTFISHEGMDFSEIGPLAEITALGTDTFNAELALEYKEKAMAELTEAGATFPVKVVVAYSANSSSWADECVVVEQQLENLLGVDYIDVELVASNESSPKTRKAGGYCMMKVNWGPDYADPNTYTDPFYNGSYNYWTEFSTDGVEEDGSFTYYNMVDDARAITSDLTARYAAFAEAEAYMINHAYLIPYGYDNGGYTASLLDPFTAQYAPAGLSEERYKGQILLDDPMNTDEYYDALDAWQTARAEALAAQTDAE